MTLLEQEYKLIKDKGECFDIEEVTQLVLITLKITIISWEIMLIQN